MGITVEWIPQSLIPGRTEKAFSFPKVPLKFENSNLICQLVDVIPNEVLNCPGVDIGEWCHYQDITRTAVCGK